MEVSKEIKSIFSRGFMQLQNSTENDKKHWIKLITKQMQLHNRAIRSGKFDIGLQNKFQSDLCYFKYLKAHIKRLLTPHIGGSLSKKRSDGLQWEDVHSAFRSRIRTGMIINLNHKDIVHFLNNAFFLFKSRIRNILKTYQMIKVNVKFCGEFVKFSSGREISELKYFNTKNEMIDNGTSLVDWYQEFVKDKILTKLQEFSEKDSGFALNKIMNLEVNINKFEFGNHIGSSYIKLPNEISRKHACINVKNNDSACFAWAVVSALYPNDNHSDRVASYPNYKNVLNVEGIEFPMTLEQIPLFEKLNPNISINVYILELIQLKLNMQYNTVPVRICKNKKEKHVNLLMIQNIYFPKINNYETSPIDETLYNISFHYCWIKNLSKLVNKQLNLNGHKKFICDRCLNYFLSEEKLIRHDEYCSQKNKCKISFPKQPYVNFNNYKSKQILPFVLYADFESMLVPYNDTKNLSQTKKYQSHIPYSAGYYFKCSYDNNLSFYNSYRGNDCMDWFAKQLEVMAKFIESKNKNIVPMIVDPKLISNNTGFCHICEKPFGGNDVIVRDHDHFTGEIRGLAHNICNLNYQKGFIIPIVFHNLTGYDSHFIIKSLGKNRRISLLPINKEKYISFTLNDNETDIKFRFIDSFRFLGASLDELASTLPQDKFQNLKSVFSNLNDSSLKLLTRKGVFCYDYIDSLEKLNEPNIPTIKDFYNKLNDCELSQEEYDHAQTVFNHFHLNSLGEYSDLYLKTDVMLLTDIFENFRDKAHKTYGLDPAWYYTMPGYTWNCMLKYTECKLETIQDVDMLLFIEHGIRGGICQCCNRYAEANNKYLPNYNPGKQSSYLLYLDVNNLYGWAMCQSLPYGGFEWIENTDNFDVNCIADDAPEGCILEVDLEYPKELHKTHKDLPFCAEHQVPPGSKLPKLMSTLYPKKKYVIHYRNLKQVLANGLKLTKIHRVLKFKQSPWLKPYIDLNTKLRTQATTNFEINLYKLSINAIFGKTMENIRKHRIVKLVNKWEGRYGAKSLISHPTFHNRTIFDEHLMAIELNKTEIVFNKPLYIGMAILEISKTCVYDFHYNFMLKNFSSKCKLLYTDTDSLIYEIFCNDIYEEIIKPHIHKFDTSNYSPNNPYDIPLVNKKVPGLMKDEAGGLLMSFFVGLRSKMYTFLINEEKCTKKAKGIKYSVVRNKISFQDYVDCLRDYTEKVVTQRTIQSFAHNVFSMEQNKVALSPYDDKRQLIPNSTDTLPWGYLE